MRIGSAPDHAAHAARAQRPSAAFESTAVGGTDDTEPTTKGGSDTPFTHALHQGNGKKVGIHRRLEAAEVATLQQEAGVAASTEDHPVDVAPVADPVEEPVVPVVDTTAGGEADPTVPADTPVVNEPIVVAAPDDLVVPDPFETPVLPVAPDPLGELLEGTEASA